MSNSLKLSSHFNSFQKNTYSQNWPKNTNNFNTKHYLTFKQLYLRSFRCVQSLSVKFFDDLLSLINMRLNRGIAPILWLVLTWSITFEKPLSYASYRLIIEFPVSKLCMNLYFLIYLCSCFGVKVYSYKAWKACIGCIVH